MWGKEGLVRCSVVKGKGKGGLVRCIVIKGGVRCGVRGV